MTYSLRTLEAKLHKTITIVSTEQLQDGPDAGKYVWRGNDGEIFMWSPHPECYAFDEVDTVTEADGLMFLCPACFAKKGPEGTHSVLVSFAGRGVPNDAGSRGTKGSTRWTVQSGTTIDDLVLTPSIALNQGLPADGKFCQWHGFVGSNGIPPGHAG